MKQDARQLLIRITDFSPYFRHIVNRRPSVVEELFDQEGYRFRATPTRLASRLERRVADLKDFQDFCRVLRHFKQEELLRLAARDWGGISSFSQTVKDLSVLAQVCLKASLHFCLLEAAGFTRDRGVFSLVQGLVVLALGKLGGEELNFSSDIDLVFLYRPTAKTPLSLPEQKAWIQDRVRRVIQTLSALVEGDQVFRVDLNLRPGGKDSELVLSWDSALEYYQNEARTWERLAWIKARPVAGNQALGQAFLRRIAPVIYRKFVDYTVLSEIRSLKEKILAESRSRFLQEDNIKLGPGGIREIEFIVQTMQLIFGGRIPSLRERNTLRALRRLKECSLLPEKEFRRLSSSYRFLRTLEHRLQMVHQQQTHSLPRDAELLMRLARETPFRRGRTFSSTQALLEHLRRVREGVRLAFEDLLQAPARPSETTAPTSWDIHRAFEMEEEGLKELGFRQPRSIREILLSWRKRFNPSHHRQKSFLEKSYSLLFRFALETADPDQALLLADGLLRGAAGRTALLAVLAERVSLTREIMHLFAQSRMMGRLFAQNPEMIDALVLERTVGLFSPGKGKKLPEKGKRGDPLQEKLSALRRWKSERLLSVALDELKGHSSPAETSERLSDLADQVLKETLKLAQERVDQEVTPPFSPRFGPGDLAIPFCVLGLGRLGGRELSYLSDLDLIFVYSFPFPISAADRERHSPDRKDKKKVTPHEYLVRLAQRLISYLSLPLKEGPGYSVDTRLRPSGNVGPLIVSLEAFTDYYRKEARNWEKQALLKARTIAGPRALAEEIHSRIQMVLFDRPPLPSVAQEMVHYRLRMEKERSGEKEGRINPKLGFGGLTDIEFIVQYQQWRRGGDIPAVRGSNTLRALEALKDNDCLSARDAVSLREAYHFLTLLDHALQLAYDLRGDPRTYLPQELRQVAEWNVLGLGEKDRPGWDVVSHYRKVTRQVRNHFNRFFLSAQSIPRRADDAPP